MPGNRSYPAYPLPIKPDFKAGSEFDGYLTVTQDIAEQVVRLLPKRVLPIIFLPGIMCSNLRMNKDRQALLNRDNNIAWRPENKTESIAFGNASLFMRQLQLDPKTTEVDEYDPVHNPTGNKKESADDRNTNVQIHIETPLLMDDLVSTKPRKTKNQKARERGWGEVYFNNYRAVLEMCELRLNTAYNFGRLDKWWKQILDVKPAVWQACPQTPLLPLEEKNLKDIVEGCWFPVHAMGYNWLQSNVDSGKYIAKRITALMARYTAQGYQCEKVIVVTHSMGGLVARALVHPEMGNMQDSVLGIVFGEMPAIGAAAAYKRMRCGFEDPGIISTAPFASIASKVMGNFGSEVTAVLANSPGALQLLPSQDYGNGWLQVKIRGQMIKTLPQKGDPYEEIYKLKGKWYGLLREEWINPAGDSKGGFGRTAGYLDDAKYFHKAIANTYHEQSYAHYGADPEYKTWHHVVWEINPSAFARDFEILSITEDNEQGKLQLQGKDASTLSGAGADPNVKVTLQHASEPGDQTVPLHSSEQQLFSHKFKGIFRQSGYDHQGSYQDDKALHSTLYSLVRIAQTMTWSKK